MSASADRPRYRPSGRVDPERLPAALALLAATSAAVAAGYCAMIAGGVYFSAVSVFFPVVAVAIATRAAVKHAHCRSRVLAGVVGAACGLAGYLGYFHLDQCLRWGAPWAAVERLPGYVAFRMETDDWEMLDRGAVLRPKPPAPGVRPVRALARAHWRTWNWAGFFFEALVLAAAPLVTGVKSAAEPYGERRRRWCSRESLTLAPDAGRALRRALAEGTVAAWVEAGPRKVAAHQEHCTVSVWYTPALEGEEPEVEAFVTAGGGAPLRLAPEETAAFVALLPAVRDIAGPSLAELAEEAERSGDPDSARVRPVPPPYAGRSQNPRNRLLGKCLRWGLLVLPLPLVGTVLIGGTYLVYELAFGLKVAPPEAIVVYAITAGISCLVFSRWWYHPEQRMPIVLGIRLDHGLIRRAVAERPSPLVAADDPRAVFAEMTPRRLWSQGTAKCGEYNQGLLLVDGQQGMLLFEGDYERYWIPAAAVLACDVEALPGLPATTAGLYAVVLRVRLGGGEWEFPLFPLAGIEGRNNWERAMALRRRVEGLCGRSFGAPLPAPPPDPGPVVG
jgi:hypothetical protein